MLPPPTPHKKPEKKSVALPVRGASVTSSPDTLPQARTDSVLPLSVSAGADDAQRWYRMAAAALTEERLEEAIAGATQATSLDAAHFRAWVCLGSAYARAGRNTQAVPCFLRALALSPQNIACWTDLGEAYIALLDYEHGAQALRQAVALDPHAADPAGRRARAVVGRTLSFLTR